MAQQLNAGNYAILAKRKSLDAVITGGTQCPRTPITLNHRGVFLMISAVHHLSCRLSLALILIMLTGRFTLFGLGLIAIFRFRSRALLSAWALPTDELFQAVRQSLNSPF